MDKNTKKEFKTLVKKRMRQAEKLGLIPDTKKREFGIYHNTNTLTTFKDTLKEGQRRDYKFIGTIIAKDLDEVWRLSQNDFGHEEYIKFGARSLSVGDMVLDDNDFYLVKGIGFEYLLSISPEGGE